MEEGHHRRRSRRPKTRKQRGASTEVVHPVRDSTMQTGSTNGSASNPLSEQTSGDVESEEPPRRMISALPDGWLDYTSIGELIPGMRILCCKTPIDNMSLYRFEPVPSDVAFTCQHFFDRMSHKSIKIGLVIDLTFSTRYYRGEDMEINHGIQHKKILVAGRTVPTEGSFRSFRETVDTFLANAPSDQAVAVHCTHGVNRTGWFVCRYMMEKLSLSYEEAHHRFSEARGHPIHRDYLTDDLKRRNVVSTQSLAPSSHIRFTEGNNFKKLDD